MKKTKVTKKKGFTLFEMLTAIAVLALLGVMITVGTNLATKSMSKSLYLSNSSLLSDTVNKAMSDVLRYSVPTNGQDFAETNNVKFSCDIYAVDNGNFTVNENGFILLDFGNTKVHDGEDEIIKAPALLVNEGTYTGLKITALEVRFDDTNKVYTGTYTIKSDELGLEKDSSFTVKPFDIKYQQGETDEDINWNNPTDIHRHSLKNWTRYDDKTCFATCESCGQQVYRNHVISDEDLITIDELKRTLTTCYAVYEGELPEIICVNCGSSIAVTIPSSVPHNLDYIQNTGETAALQHTVICKNPYCTYRIQEEHKFTIDSYDEDSHTLKCACGYLLEGAHEPDSGTESIIESKKRALQCGESTDFEFVCKECKQLISIKIEAAHPEHKLSLVNDNNNGHKVSCDYCNYYTLENHEKTELKPLSGIIGNDSNLYHAYFCKCGYFFESEKQRHKYVPTMIISQDGVVNTEVHENKCACGDVALADSLDIFNLTTRHRSNDYIPTADNSKHIRACECGYNPGNNREEDHTFTWAKVDDEYHAYLCSKCGYEQEGTREKHNISQYREKTGDNASHYAKCSKCDWFEQSHVEEREKKSNWAIISGDDSHNIACSLCGKTLRSEPHQLEYVDNGDGKHSYKCSACGYVDKTDNHSFGKYITDDNQHWRVCSLCKYVSAKENHDWVTKNDGTDHWQECSVCKEVKDATEHTIEETYTTDGSQHWKKCSGCGYKVSVGNHELRYEKSGSQHWQVCSVCEYATAKTNHSGTGSYKSDATNHWKLCVCGEKVGVTSHTWGNATEIRGDNTNHKRKCTICNYEKTEAHVREIEKKDSWQFISGSNSHNIVCSLCNYGLGTESHDFTYTSTGNEKHTISCPCGYSDTKNHSLTYTDYDNNQHTAYCTDCKHSFLQDHKYTSKVDGGCNRCPHRRW